MLAPVKTHSSGPAPSACDLAALLRADLPASGVVDRLKIRFRPYICPFDLLLGHIEDGKSYCDVGCGSGALLRIVAEYKHPAALAGWEVSAGLVENARAVLEAAACPVQLDTYDGTNVPSSVGDYDYLFLIDVLHHIVPQRQFSFLAQLFERMHSGQRLLVKEINADSPLVYWNKLHDVLVSREVGHERGASTLQEWLEQIGFDVKLLFKRRVFLYPHFALMCQKP
jgi:cyclopropane fatty-acyl-phospholipid synthase-like methyltransferase